MKQKLHLFALIIWSFLPQMNAQNSAADLLQAALNTTSTSASSSPNTCNDFAWALQIVDNSTANHNIDVKASSTDLNGNIILMGGLSGPYQLEDVNQNTSTLSGAHVFVASISPSGTLNWLNTNVSTGSNVSFPSDLAIDDQGSVYVIGRYNAPSNPIEFRGTNSSITIPTGAGSYIAKYTANGVITWVSRQQKTKGINIDVNDGILVASYTLHGSVNIAGVTHANTGLSPSTLIARINPISGTYVWAESIIGASTFDFAVPSDIKTGNNAVYIVGEFSNSITFQGVTHTAPSTSGYVLKLTTSGNQDWFKTIPLGPTRSIELSNTCNDIYVSGRYDSPTQFSFDGHTIPTIIYGPASNIFLASLNAEGVANWLSPINGDVGVNDGSRDNLELDNYDNIYVSGHAVERQSGIDDVFSGSVGIDLSLPIGGSFSFSFKFLKNGEPVSVNDHNQISSATYDKVNNRYFLAGIFNSPVQFGATTLNGGSSGNSNVYLAPSQQTPFAGVANSCIEICLGETVALEAFAHYGSATSYTWSPNTSLDVNNADVVNFTPTSPGVYDYVVTIEDANGCTDKAHVEIEVLDAPPTISFPNEMCFNSSNVFATVPDPTAGSWSASCGSCLNYATGEFSPSVAGVGTHQLYFNLPCGEFAVKTFTVNPDFVCCLDKNMVNKAIILKGVISQVSLNIPDGSTVIIERDVTFDNMTLNWKDVNIFVEGRVQNGNVIGSKIELFNTKAKFTNCSFQSTCKTMWEGIKIGKKSKTIFEKCQIKDAYKGIEVLDNSIKEIRFEYTTFSNNFYSAYFKTGEFNFPIKFSHTKFNSDNAKMKSPYNYVSANNNFFTEAHFHFEKGCSRLFPFSFNNNVIRNCKYGIYAEDNFDFGVYIFKSDFVNCFATAIHSKKTVPSFNGGNGPTNDLTVSNCHFKFPQQMPATAQFTNLTGIYGIIHSTGDLEVTKSEFVGSSKVFTPDFGIYFSNPGYNLTVQNNRFRRLGNAIQTRIFGSKWLILKQGGQTQLVSRATKLDITSNFFINNDLSIKLLTNKYLSGWIPQTSAGATNTSACPNCPLIDMSLVNQRIRCNEFSRSDGNVNYAIYVEPNTFTVDIDGPAGNEIVDPSFNTRSVWNNGDPFKYIQYVNENVSTYPSSNSSIPNSVGFFSSGTVAVAQTCPGNAGVRLSDSELEKLDSDLTVNLFPNPSSTGIVQLELSGFKMTKNIRVVDIHGRTISETSINTNNTNIDLSNNAKGMYFVIVSDGTNNKSRKLILN